MIFQSRYTEKLHDHHSGHTRSPVSKYLKEVVYGGVDGIITTFAVVAGFTGASFSNEATTQLSFIVVLLFGLANLFADATSMGLGNFLSVRSEQSLYKNLKTKEGKEAVRNIEMETAETKETLVKKGFSEADAETLTGIFRKNEKFWLEFIMDHELNIEDPTGERPFFTGLATALAFIVFGFIPLIPFIVMGTFEKETVFVSSAGGALTALILLGVLKWKVVGTAPFRSIGEIVLVGGVAACIAFFVGSLFTF